MSQQVYNQDYGVQYNQGQNRQPYQQQPNYQYPQNQVPQNQNPPQNQPQNQQYTVSQSRMAQAPYRPQQQQIPQGTSQQVNQMYPPKSEYKPFAQNIQNVQQPYIHQQQQVTHVHNVEHLPLVHEIHHIERPVQVVGIEEVEQPWRVKVMVYEKQLIELQLLVKKGGNARVETQSVVVEDTNKIKKLQKEIEELEGRIREIENMIMDAQAEFERLSMELENSSSNEEITYMTSELEIWKKKFIDLNRKFHSCQEDMMMKQAELDSLRSKKNVVVHKEVRSGNVRESDTHTPKVSHQTTSHNYSSKH